MRLSSTLLAACSLIASATQAGAQDKARLLDAYVAARARLGQFNGTVLVAQQGRILLEKGYGLANVEHRVPAGAETRYAIASITKNFTDAALLRLQEAGKLTLADSLCRWVEQCPDAWRAVTLAEMVHHTSGIPDYESALDLGSPAYIDFMSQSNSAARIVEQARTKPLDFVPGSKFRYSNTAYILLGTVIEKASGVSYAQFVHDAVLVPAGISDMMFASRDGIVPHLASGYRRNDMDFATVQAGVTLDEHTLHRESLLPLDGPHADANLIATAHDLWRWTEALADSTALTPSSIREMFAPGLAGYGAGWFIDQRFGRRIASHTGSLPGYTSVIEWYPDSRTLLVLLSNTTGVRLSVTLRDLAAIVFDQPYDLPVARKLVSYDSAASARLVGEYALADGGKAIVTAEKTMLSIQIPGRFTAGAFPTNDGKWYAPFFDNTLRFDGDSAGAPTKIMLRINGATLAGTRQ